MSPDGGRPDAALAPVILSPADGTSLRARRQLFTWSAGGHALRLRIGTSVGAADVFDSGPLGSATTVTVEGLPLTGATFFAELSSGPDEARVSSAATYRAPLRRGVCVVVDYADVGLEDWQGEGMNDVAEVAAQLHAMEAHWDWLSRGLEKASWDIVRVQLPTTLAETSFAGWSDFRDEVVRLTKQQVSVADYDVDGNGVLDAIFAIVSSQGTRPGYAIGGTSLNQGASIFVDDQDSLSVAVQATGNFNHELGHTIGLPDLYGPYGTLGDLTLMSGSWPLPPNDFSAYERVRLGWLEPLVVDHGVVHVVAPSADDTMFAVRVPGAQPEEYFLLEYRRKPLSGYGSAASFDFDGLAVYHVFEPSNQGVDPPLVKLEPADGTTSPDYQPEADDLAFPENPGLRQPFVLHSYLGGDPVFAIDGLARTPAGELAFDVTVLEPGSTRNLVENPGVETGVAGWQSGGWMPDLASFAWADVGANGSGHSLWISAPVENDVEWATPVSGLVPGGAGYLCGYLKGQDVTGGAGATLAISGTFVHTEGAFGTFDWTRRCTIAPTAVPAAAVACRLGGFAATTSGEMWCDDVSFARLDSAFAPIP